MQVHLRTRRAAQCALAGVLALAGCSTGAPTGTTTGGPPATANTTPVPTTAAPTETPVMILEDAGLETPMAAGTYTSRLFQPTVTIELDGSWFRRDAGDARKFNIRRGDGAEDLTFYSGIDFVQCGDGEVVEAPDSSTVVDMLFGMPKLDATQPAELQVGSLTGTEVRFLGGGKGSLDDPIEEWLSNGCVLSFGDVPFPGDSGWMVELGMSEDQLVFVDVEGQTVLIRTRHGGDREAAWDYMRQVIGTVQFG